jgi:hypothetical protein
MDFPRKVFLKTFACGEWNPWRDILGMSTGGMERRGVAAFRTPKWCHIPRTSFGYSSTGIGSEDIYSLPHLARSSLVQSNGHQLQHKSIEQSK